MTTQPSPDYSILIRDIQRATISLRENNRYLSCLSDECNELLLVARTLVSVLEQPDTSLWRVVFAPQGHASLRTAFEMGIFDSFHPTSKSISLEELSSIVGVENVLLRRIMRALTSMGIFAEGGEDMYIHNEISSKLNGSMFRTFAMGLAGAVSEYMPRLPDYLSRTSYYNPSNPSDNLFNYAKETPLSMFEWLQTQPDKLAAFGEVMAAANTLKTKGVLEALSRLYSSPQITISSAADRILLVDVGGGKGNLLERFRAERPDLVGRMILQDLPKVIEGRKGMTGVESMVHDFFMPQPIKGADVYFFRHIFHDWPDRACLAILRNTISAMNSDSRIVIADMVLPNTGASLFGSLLDIGMMTNAGMERTERHWRELLGSAGLRIMDIRNPTREENESASIIQATLAVDDQ